MESRKEVPGFILHQPYVSQTYPGSLWTWGLGSEEVSLLDLKSAIGKQCCAAHICQ